MVTIRRRAAGKNMTGRLRPSDASVGDSNGKASLVQLKSARRSDQRSVFSITGSVRSSSRSTLKRNETAPATLVTVATATEPSTDAAAVRLSKGSRRVSASALRYQRNSGSGKGVLTAYANTTRFLHANNATSNSAGQELANRQDSGSNNLCGRQAQQPPAGRRSFESHRQTKTVSISASQDGTGSSYQLQNSHSDLTAKRSIIKLKPLPINVLFDAHNKQPVSKTPRENQKTEGTTSTQALREQRIFRECRFIPIDTFYQKVIIAPNQDRKFFAAPRCARVRGSRNIYDILGDNMVHHRDVNCDFTRDLIKKAHSRYSKPSQFRHAW